MRRASTGRRRLGSGDSLSKEDIGRAVYKHMGIRSRSQERSIAPNEDKSQHSVVSTADGSESWDAMLEDIDSFEPHATPVTLFSGSQPKSNVSEKYHKRSASDPLDVSGLEDAETISTSSQGTLTNIGPSSWPTLPRYPVAETRDLNCWSEPQVDIFKVRGKNYLKDRNKVSSAPYLFRARGCDLLLFPNEGHGDDFDMIERSAGLLNGTLRTKPTLVLNFRFPWGLMPLHFEFPENLLPFLQKLPKNQQHMSHNPTDVKVPDLASLTPGERTLALWMMGDTNYKNQRLKLIPYVVQGPWVVRNLVTGKPAIIGTKLPVSYQVSGNLLVAELDIGNSSATAKRIVGLCRRYMNALTCDIGFVIQGNTEAELPEQMLGAIRIHGVDPIKAPSLG